MNKLIAMLCLVISACCMLFATIKTIAARETVWDFLSSGEFWAAILFLVAVALICVFSAPTQRSHDQ